jgi:ribosome-binding ATPase YchF (GTP1/OBG family)
VCVCVYSGRRTWGTSTMTSNSHTIEYSKTLNSLYKISLYTLSHSFSNSLAHENILGCLGFSEGAIVWMDMIHRFQSEQRSSLSSQTPLPLSFFISFGLPSYPLKRISLTQMRIIHFYGEKDELIDVANLKCVCQELGSFSSLVAHPQGHVVPTSTQILLPFFDCVYEIVKPKFDQKSDSHDLCEENSSFSEDSSLSQRQKEEIESLEMIFDRSIQRKLNGRLAITIDCDSPHSFQPKIILLIHLPSTYPDDLLSPPNVTIESLHCCPISSAECSQSLRTRIDTALSAYCGEEILFGLIEDVREWLLSHLDEMSKRQNSECITPLSHLSSSLISPLLFGTDILNEDFDESTDTSLMRWATEEAMSVHVIHYGAQHVNDKIVDERGENDDNESNNNDDGAVSDEKGTLPNNVTSFSVDDEKEFRNLIRDCLFDGGGMEGSGGGESGEWKRFCIGLVGKPSSGKSTFYNAAIRAVEDLIDVDHTTVTSSNRAAKVAAFPFTTIEPNMAWGCVEIPESPFCVKKGSNPKYGLVRNLDKTYSRRVPIFMKDVAGLVRGAYQGRGRGNAFLNDLCDADVLIHVIDGSGKSDGGGNLLGENEEYDVSDDIIWVYEEIHRWIYTNISRKWKTILRDPLHLPRMFSGYRCTPAVIWRAMHCVGIRNKKQLEENVKTYTRKELHLLVAHFLHLRFPVILALNKCDIPSSQSHYRSVTSRFPYYTILRMSAKVECHLQILEKYLLRQSFFPTAEISLPFDCSHTLSLFDKLKSQCHPRMIALFEDVRSNLSVLQQNSSGVGSVLLAALLLKSPQIVLPVVNFETFHSKRIKTESGRTLKSESSSVVVTPGSGQGKGCGGQRSGGRGGKVEAKVKTTKKSKKEKETGQTNDLLDLSLEIFGEKSNPILRETILLRPGASTLDLFKAMKRKGVVEGEFVRAEKWVVGDEGRGCAVVMKKNERVGSGGMSIQICKVITNNRTKWQT